MGGLVSFLLAKGASTQVVDPRPFLVDGVRAWFPSSTDNGFPSDHTLFATVIAAAMWPFHECHVFRFRNAQHIVGVDYQSRIPDARTPLDGYFLANVAQIYPDDRGTNFAVRDGASAADLIHRELTAATLKAPYPDSDHPDQRSVVSRARQRPNTPTCALTMGPGLAASVTPEAPARGRWAAADPCARTGSGRRL